MIHRSPGLVLCSLLLLACTESVAVQGTGGGGSGAAGGDGGAGAIGGTGGTVTGGGGTAGTGGTGGVEPSCPNTHDHFTFTLLAPDGGHLDCSVGIVPGGPSSVTHIEGIVIASTSSTYEIDACPPGTACMPLIYHLSVDSPGFSTYLDVGRPVQLDVTVDFPWACTSSILAQTLPSWEGSSESPALLFAGADGAAAAPAGAPFTVTATPLGCNTSGESCGVTVADSYRFDVSGLTQTSVNQGEEKVLAVPWGANGSAQVFFRNLRSFESGYCDDYWNYAFRVVPVPPPD